MGYKEILQKRQSEENNTGENKESAEITALVEHQRISKFFGIESIHGFPTCIDLRLRDGSSSGLPYSYIMAVNYSPSEGLEILTAAKKITIEGRNLQMLYNHLLSYRVKYIQANIGNDLTDEKELFIKEISIHEL